MKTRIYLIAAQVAFVLMHQTAMWSYAAWKMFQ